MGVGKGWMGVEVKVISSSHEPVSCAHPGIRTEMQCKQTKGKSSAIKAAHRQPVRGTQTTLPH